MVGLSLGNSNLFLGSSSAVRAHDLNKCYDSYEFIKTNFSQISGDERFVAMVTLLGRVICVLVDYIPLVGKISQWTREAFFGLDYANVIRQNDRVAAEQINVSILDTSGAQINMSISAIDTVLEFKQAIAEKKGIDVSQFDLFVLGEEEKLVGDRLVNSCGDQDPLPLFMVERPISDKQALVEYFDEANMGRPAPSDPFSMPTLIK